MSSIFPSKNKSLDMACRRDFKHSLVHHVSLDSFFEQWAILPWPGIAQPGKNHD